MEKIPNLLCTGRTNNALLKKFFPENLLEFRLFSPELLFCVLSIILLVCFPGSTTSFKEANVNTLRTGDANLRF